MTALLNYELRPVLLEKFSVLLTWYMTSLLQLPCENLFIDLLTLS